jgi:hypothetical protein
VPLRQIKVSLDKPARTKCEKLLYKMYKVLRKIGV